MEQYKVSFDPIPWQRSLPGSRSKSYSAGGKKLRLVEFTDEFVEPDWCRKAHIGYVLEGELEINFSGSIVKFRAGDGLFIPGGEESKHMPKIPSGVARLVLVEDEG